MRPNKGLGYDPTNPEADAEAEAADQLATQTKAERDVADFLSIMKTPEGRRFLARLMDRTHMFASSFTGNSQTFMLEGERNIGLWLWDQIQADALDLFVTMQKERDV